MAKKMRPALTSDQKKRLAYNRKKGVLIIIILLLVALIGVEVVMIVSELIGLVG